MEGTLYKKAIKSKNTIVAPSAWVAIANALGETASKMELETQQKWASGGYNQNYLEWMGDTIEIHKRFKLNQATFCQIIDDIDFTDGAHVLLENLKKNGIITSLVSGGFKYQADKAQRLLGIDHALSGCEYFWNEEGYLEHYNLLPADYEGKVDFMRSIAREYGVSMESCAFVGDGDNDCGLAKAVGLSIAFNGSQNLKNIASISIDNNSLSAIENAIAVYNEKYNSIDENLFVSAQNAAKNTYSPFSKFPVGAAILAKSGKIYTGTNVENSSYGLTNCAERVAIQNAISAGERMISRVAIYSPNNDVSPCGACRQVIAEFSNCDAAIIYKWDGQIVKRNIAELLPHTFRLTDKGVEKC